MTALRRFLRVHRFLARHAGLLCGLSLALTIAFGLCARRLELRTDLTELLPADHPAVAALREVTPRQRSASSLALIIEADDPARAAAFVAAVRPSLQALVPAVLTQIDWGQDPEPADFARRWRWVYASLADLGEVERLAEALVAKRSSPLYVDLDDDPADELARLDQKMRAHLPARPSHASFASDDGRKRGIRLWRGRDGLGGAGDHETLAAVRRTVTAVQRGFREVRVHYTGPIAQAVEEQAAIRDDLSIATIACVALLLGALYLAFGSVTLVASALWPTIAGLAAALALAAIALGSLNLNTAFLVSIILGNGINGPIVLLGELGRQRARGLSLPRALPRAILASAPGVGAAMLAAAASYAVLGATRFRGFRQFGLIGGVGMSAVLVATFVVLPPLLLLLDRHAPRLVAPGRDRFSPLVARAIAFISRPSRARVIAGTLCMLAAAGALRFAQDPIEWDLSRLRARSSEADRLWGEMERLGMGSVGAGYIANTAVMLVDDAADADRVAQALLAQDRAHDRLLAEARTLGSLLPTDQPEKLATLGRLRALVDRELQRHGTLFSSDDRERLTSARPPDELRVVTVDDLPRVVREAFTEIDGTRGRFIGIDASARHYHDWDGHTLLGLARALRVEVGGRVYVAAAPATVFSGMLATLLDDAPRLSLLALAVVALILGAIFGRWACSVLAALALGLFWLAGAAGLLGLRLNFMSFAAIPISIGVGADYAANIWARVRAGTRALDGIAATVVLCSLTTVIGYSTLLLGRNGALRSFGLLCDLGEVTCLLAALLSPVLLRRCTRSRP